MLIRYVAAGLCHSDEHLRHGDIVPRFPIVGGHEGAGIIEKVGPGVTRREGGRPRRLLLPAGLRALPLVLHRPLEPLRPRARRSSTAACPTARSASTTTAQDLGGDVHARHASRQYSTISETRCVTVDEDLPLETVVLVGCGVPTGWGSAVYAADVEPGDTVDHLRHRRHRHQRRPGRRATPARRNVIAIDPLANKRETAEELGATHSRGQRRGGPGAHRPADPRRRRRQGDRHRRHRQRGGRRRARSTRSARAAPRSSPASPTRTSSPSSCPARS